MSHFILKARWILSLALLVALGSSLGARTALAAGVVGTGTPGSCTETAFDTALTGGNLVTFNCGPNTVGITLTFNKSIMDSTIIDGGNKIILKAPNTYHFLVYSGVTLSLKNIELVQGNSSPAGSIQNIGTLKTNHVTFHNNKSSDLGGAIHNYGIAKIKNSIFTKNHAVNGGGAIYNDGGNVTIRNTTFSGNKGTGSGAVGGAIGNKAGDVRIINSLLKANAANDGGAVWTDYGSTNMISKTTISSNKAFNGGGVENFGGMQIINSTISDNQAANVGGGISHGGSMSFELSTLSGNKAPFGGGMRDFGNSTFIYRSTISANEATGEGGGIYSTANTGVENSTFSANKAGAANGGGAFVEDGGEATLVYVTIANNSGTFGGGVYAKSSSNSKISLEKVVLSNNPGGNCSGATLVSQGYNLSSDHYCGSAFTLPTDKNHKNPKLGPLANNGGPTLTHLPLAGSPLIDKGGPAGSITIDQRGLSRPQGPATDIGAVEVK